MWRLLGFKSRRPRDSAEKAFQCQEPGCSARFYHLRSLKRHARSAHMSSPRFVALHSESHDPGDQLDYTQHTLPAGYLNEDDVSQGTVTHAEAGRFHATMKQGEQSDEPIDDVS